MQGFSVKFDFIVHNLQPLFSGEIYKALCLSRCCKIIMFLAEISNLLQDNNASLAVQGEQSLDTCDVCLFAKVKRLLVMQ